MTNILIIIIPVLLIISFLWALWSLKKELQKETNKKAFHELRKEEPVILTD